MRRRIFILRCWSKPTSSRPHTATKPCHPPYLLAPSLATFTTLTHAHRSPPAESTTTTTLCSSQSPKPTNQNSSRTWRMLHSPAAAAGAVARGGGGGWGSNSTRHDATRLDSTQSRRRRRRRRHRGYNLYPTIHLANTLTRNPPPPLPPLSTSPTLGLSPVSARQMKVATIARVAQATRNMPPPRLKCKVCIASIFRQACRVREREGEGAEKASGERGGGVADKRS